MQNYLSISKFYLKELEPFKREISFVFSDSNRCPQDYRTTRI